ncbi:MAG: hypothetical protein ACXIUW_06410, partial [Roseinatronobacter sp.]
MIILSSRVFSLEVAPPVCGAGSRTVLGAVTGLMALPISGSTPLTVSMGRLRSGMRGLRVEGHPTALGQQFVQ